MHRIRYNIRWRGSPGPGWLLSLFLEATQRKTVRSAIISVGIEAPCVEIQAMGVVAVDCQRPAVAAVTDLRQLSGLTVAVARGRASHRHLGTWQGDWQNGRWI